MSARPRIAVIGAGAAGLMAAWHAANGDADVVLIERKRDGGRKILVSGGGRCNVLPVALQPERFVTDSSPHTLKNLLLGWPLREQRAFFEEELGVPLRLEDEAKYFPVSGRAREVRDRLFEAARSRGVAFHMGRTVRDLRRDGDGWRVCFDEGEALRARRVILATGGLSVPQTGSDGIGLEIARAWNHRIVEPYPALTPLLANDPAHHALSGLSVPVRLEVEGRKEHYVGSFLFTHRGYSGPVALDASHHVVREHATLRASWGGRDRAHWEGALQERGRRTLRSRLREELPERLVDLLLERTGIDLDRTLAEMRREERLGLLEALTHTRLDCHGHEGYRKAEVTGGGVHLAEVDARTLESRRAPGLFLCGEILDAFGPIGGHNFAWAWATGRRAGLAATRAAALRPE